MVVGGGIFAGDITLEGSAKPTVFYDNHVKLTPQGVATINRDGLQLKVGEDFSTMDVTQGSKTSSLQCHMDKNHQD